MAMSCKCNFHVSAITVSLLIVLGGCSGGDKAPKDNGSSELDGKKYSASYTDESRDDTGPDKGRGSAKPVPRAASGVRAVGETAKTKQKGRRGDVVLVHGLEGDDLTTWEGTKGDYDDFWPQWLADDRPDVAVWSVWYPAVISKWEGGSMAYQGRAKQLLEALRLRGIGTHKPVVFVAHSLGGIVVKQMLRISDDASRGGDTDQRFKNLVRETRGVVFLATPHTGSGLGSYLENLAVALGITKFGRQSALVQQLRKDAPELLDLNEWYRQNVRRLHIATEALYETTEYAPGHFVVDESAADANVPGVSAIGVDADHITIAKPVSRDTDVYLSVIDFVDKKLIQDDPWEVTLKEAIDEFNKCKADQRLDAFNHDYGGRRVRFDGIVRKVIAPKEDPGWMPGYMISVTPGAVSTEWVLASFDRDTFRQSVKEKGTIRITGRVGRENSFSGLRLDECGWQDEEK